MNDQLERDLFEMLDRRSASAEVRPDLQAVYRDARAVDPSPSTWGWMVDVLSDRRMAFAGTLGAVVLGVVGVAALIAGGASDITVVPAGEAEVPGDSTTVTTGPGSDGGQSSTTHDDITPTSVYLSEASTRDAASRSTTSFDVQTTVVPSTSAPVDANSSTTSNSTSDSTTGSSVTTPTTGTSLPPTTGNTATTNTMPQSSETTAPVVTWAYHNGTCIGRWSNSTSPTTITYFDETGENCGATPTTEGSTPSTTGTTEPGSCTTAVSQTGITTIPPCP